MAFLDLVAGIRADRLHGPGKSGIQAVFHLHGLKHSQLLAFGDMLAGLGRKLDDLARHRRLQAGAGSPCFFIAVEHVTPRDIEMDIEHRHVDAPT